MSNFENADGSNDFENFGSSDSFGVIHTNGLDIDEPIHRSEMWHRLVDKWGYTKTDL
jgi:hypothetical protein